MKAQSQYKRHKIIRVAAFLTLTAGLLAWITYFTWIRRSLGTDVASLTTVRNRLQAMTHRLETGRQQAENDKKIVLNVLDQCRSADDIPDLPWNRIVAGRRGFENLYLYVPQGSHTLVVSSTWKPTAALDQSTDAKATFAAQGGEKNWRVPLVAASGYSLQLSSDRNGGPIQWQLTGNHSDFQPQKETVPVDGFSHRGSSWTNTDVVQYSNQISWNSSGELEAAARGSTGVKLMHATFSGVAHDQPYEVVMDVQIFSDAPACVSAMDAQRLIILGRGDLLEPYAGGGKYAIRNGNTTLP